MTCNLSTERDDMQPITEKREIGSLSIFSGFFLSQNHCSWGKALGCMRLLRRPKHRFFHAASVAAPAAAKGDHGA